MKCRAPATVKTPEVEGQEVEHTNSGRVSPETGCYAVTRKSNVGATYVANDNNFDE